MQKIDRLGWVAGVTFTWGGIRMGVRCNDATLLADVVAGLPPGWRPSRAAKVDRLYSFFHGGKGSGRVRRFNLVYGGSLQLARTLDLRAALDALQGNLCREVAEASRDRVFVHAGVVGWKGRAILIPGRSFSGKSTLVAELLRAGATYYSDEYAPLDAEGRVHPFPAPLSLREGPDVTRRTAAEDLGGPVGREPLPVGLVAMSAYEPGCRWRPRRLTSGQAVLAVLEHTIPARERPAEVLATLHRTLRDVPVLRGRRGEAQDTAGRLLEAVAS